MTTRSPLLLLLAALLAACAFAAKPAATNTSPYVPGRVIVLLDAPPLAQRFGPALEEHRRKRVENDLLANDGEERHKPDRFNWLIARDAEARQHLELMESERVGFLRALGNALGLSPTGAEGGGARHLVVRTRDSTGEDEEAIFSITLHGMALRVPDQFLDRTDEFMSLVRRLPHVRSVSREPRIVPLLFSSGEAINVSAAYDTSAIGGLSNAGAGIKIASLDTGVYAGAPMFNGTGYSYPPGWNNVGRGDLANCNGKVIVSKNFTLDPSNPGPEEDSHGAFTSSIAAGIAVNATIGGVTREIRGIAPQAWIMNYRFLNGGSAIQALEAAVNDGADVMINSWGQLPVGGGPYDPTDLALINAVKAGAFVAMAAGNEGPVLSSADHPSDDYITVAASSKSSYLDTSLDEVVPSTPFVIANFSSRGPSALRTLKPDIAAPGVNVMAQESAIFGVKSGTSFATPVVSGAAALMMQIWPAWTPKQIKAAMMGTAKWQGITTETGAIAQPLDMGAGQLDMERAIKPGALLDPPSLSFGYMPQGHQKTILVTVSSVSDSVENYTISSAFIGPDGTTSVQGISFEPSTISLEANSQAQFNVTFNSLWAGVTVGDRQGFIVLSSASGTYEVHMPLWARVIAPAANSVLILNAMGSAYSSATVDMYMSSLTALGYGSFVQEVVSTPLIDNDLYWISAYPVVFFLTGANGVEGKLERAADQSLDIVRQYVAMGGKVFLSGPMAPAMAQQPYITLGQEALIGYFANVTSPVCPTNTTLPTQVLTGPSDAPQAFQQLSFALSDTAGSRCLNGLIADGQIPLLAFEEESTVVAGSRASVTTLVGYPTGRHFYFATVTSLLSLEMLPQSIRVPFLLAVMGYLTEEVSLNISLTADQLRVSLSSSFPTTVYNTLESPVVAVVANYGDTEEIHHGSATQQQDTEVIMEVPCFMESGQFNVSVQATTAFGSVAQLQIIASVNSTQCSSAASMWSPLHALLGWFELWR